MDNLKILVTGLEKEILYALLPTNMATVIIDIIYEYIKEQPLEYVSQSYLYQYDNVQRICMLDNILYVLADGKIIVYNATSCEKIGIVEQKICMKILDIEVVNKNLYVLIREGHKKLIHVVDSWFTKIANFDVDMNCTHLISVTNPMLDESLCLMNDQAKIKFATQPISLIQNGIKNIYTDEENKYYRKRFTDGVTSFLSKSIYNHDHDHYVKNSIEKVDKNIFVHYDNTIIMYVPNKRY